MMKYLVEITETLSKAITVEASSEASALKAVSDAWHDEKIVLGADDFISHDLKIIEPQDSDFLKGVLP